MVLRRLPVAVLVGIALVAWSVLLEGAPSARAEGHRQATGGGMFYNFYVPPGACGGVTAQLYPCPRPTPPLVGHTYITYPPLAPHEFLHPHTKAYYRRNPGSGWTRTTVLWR